MRDPNTGRFVPKTTVEEKVRMAKVLNADQRKLFDGNEEDARDYVEKNFPHIVIPDSNNADEEVAATVVVETDDGSTHALVGGKWTEVDYDTKNGRFVV